MAGGKPRMSLRARPALCAGAMVVGLTCWAVTSTLAQNTDATRTPREPESAELREEDLLDKFDRILANDERILQQFDEISKELQAIKVRASLSPRVPPPPEH